MGSINHNGLPVTKTQAYLKPTAEFTLVPFTEVFIFTTNVARTLRRDRGRPPLVPDEKAFGMPLDLFPMWLQEQNDDAADDSKDQCECRCQHSGHVGFVGVWPALSVTHRAQLRNLHRHEDDWISELTTVSVEIMNGSSVLLQKKG